MSTTNYRTDRKTGKPVATIKLDPDERAVILKPGQTALVVEENAFYRLGGQLDDVVAGHVLTEMNRVAWCSIEQAWVGTGDRVHHDGSE